MHMPAVRRLLTVLAVVLAGVLSGASALPFDKYTTNRDALPEAAQEMLQTHFPRARISMIKVDRHLLRKPDYDVKLTNGTKIEFSNKGRWTSVDCKNKDVPESLVPAAIRNNVGRRYAGESIRRISRSSLYYIVGLSGSRELKYDLLGIFQGEVNSREAEAFADEALAEADSIAAADSIAPIGQ